MRNSIVYCTQKKGKRESIGKERTDMKQNETKKEYGRQAGYELLRRGAVPASVVRQFWKGSPWSALWAMNRPV